MGWTLLGVFSAYAQEGSPADYAVPYPTRSQGPSVQFGQAFQSVAPSMPNPSEGRIKVEPKLESPEGSKGREGVVTAEVKALVFVEVVEQVKTEGVPRLSGIVTGIEMLKSEDFQDKVKI